MPELPEVEVLVRHLRPLLLRKRIRGVSVLRPKVIRPTLVKVLTNRLTGSRFTDLDRRGKYLLFHLQSASRKPFLLVGHLGMTGRMYLLRRGAGLPKHTSVALDLGRETFVFDDQRFFGRLTLDTEVLEGIGPEPLSDGFSDDYFGRALKRSSQCIKVKLLDQQLVAGIGNIYASEALFRAGVSPTLAAKKLRAEQIERLWRAIRDTLSEAISCGSTVPLNYAGDAKTDRLFYFGRAQGAPDYYEERLLVYDRANQPCPRCRQLIVRLVQAARSTFYCPNCQRRGARKAESAKRRGGETAAGGACRRPIWP